MTAFVIEEKSRKYCRQTTHYKHEGGNQTVCAAVPVTSEQSIGGSITMHPITNPATAEAE